MPTQAFILADSISPRGERLITFLCTFPRFILAEVNTHKMLSKSSASSRAVPIAKRIASIESDPFVPAAFGKNKPGMQSTEVLSDSDAEHARDLWKCARDYEIEVARQLSALEVHKQYANRRLEADSYHTAIITGTEWSNFFALRDNPDAQPEFRELAICMREARDKSTPIEQPLHLPYVQCHDYEELSRDCTPEDMLLISSARCARVSYLTHAGERNVAADVKLAQRLTESGHMAPFEHAARVMSLREYKLCERVRFEWDTIGRQFRLMYDSSGQVMRDHYMGNVQGWVQARKMIANEHDFSLMVKA